MNFVCSHKILISQVLQYSEQETNIDSNRILTTSSRKWSEGNSVKINLVHRQ